MSLYIINPIKQSFLFVQTTANSKSPFLVHYSGGKCLKEYLKEHPTYKVYNKEKFMSLLEHELNKMCLNWHEIPEDRYFECLEQLPPMYYSIGFFSPEADAYDVHAFYVKHNDRYFATSARTSMTRETIKDSFDKYYTNEYNPSITLTSTERV
jgi:hypothetical protein